MTLLDAALENFEQRVFTKTPTEFSYIGNFKIRYVKLTCILRSKLR